MQAGAGILRIVYAQGYPDQLAEEMIEEAGIETKMFDESGQEKGSCQ